MKASKKLLSLLLVVMLLVSAIPFQAAASTTGGYTITFEVKTMNKDNESTPVRVAKSTTSSGFV